MRSSQVISQLSDLTVTPREKSLWMGRRTRILDGKKNPIKKQTRNGKDNFFLQANRFYHKKYKTQTYKGESTEQQISRKPIKNTKESKKISRSKKKNVRPNQTAPLKRETKERTSAKHPKGIKKKEKERESQERE